MKKLGNLRMQLPVGKNRMYAFFAYLLFISPAGVNFFEHGVEPLIISKWYAVFIVFMSSSFLIGVIWNRENISRWSGRVLLYVYPISLSLSALPYGAGRRDEFYDNNEVIYFLMMVAVLYAGIGFVLLKKLATRKNVREYPDQSHNPS